MWAERRIFIIKPCGMYSNHWPITARSLVCNLCTASFDIKKFYVLPTQCMYVFYMDLRTNSDYLPT